LAPTGTYQIGADGGVKVIIYPLKGAAAA